jgi:hypothetical protein
MSGTALNLGLLKDSGAQMRVEMNPETVADYAEEMVAGTVFPPVVLFFDGADHWLAGLWNRFGFSDGVHLRRIHYVLVSVAEDDAPILKPGGLPFENTYTDWSLLTRAGLAARYLDLVPANAFVDRRNSPARIYARGQVYEPTVEVQEDEFYGLIHTSAVPDMPYFDVGEFQAEQDYLVEVWIEKSTLDDWLVPLCMGAGVNLVTGIGELSEVACRLLAERIEQAGNPTRVLYLSDFDPAGRSMPLAVARKLEFYLRKLNLDVDVTLRPIILTEDQCREYRLPRTPIKESERRKERFEERFGAGANELDALEALHPGRAETIVRKEISRYIDPTLRQRVKEAEWAFKDRLQGIEEETLAQYEDQIEALREEHDEIDREIRKSEPARRLKEWKHKVEDVMSDIVGDLEQEQPDLDDQIPGPRPAEEPDEEPLFDSNRDYLAQLDHYHDWQRRS